MNRAYLFYSLVVIVGAFILFDHIGDVRFPARLVASDKIQIETLKEEISNRMFRVPEFKKIAELCDEMGIKNAYLFGGTASAYAHYVYWDIEREAGLNGFQQDRFDYDYTNIFRSNQDMDIVIDAEPEKAELLETELKKLFPFFQGDKSAWEVRLLRDNRADKEKILGNVDFLNQNTDSHSTGLIAITKNESIPIRDFKEWENADNHFIKDVFERKLHYYYDHAKHITTKRYQSGMNPEILSVIRYFTKAFQYDLEVQPTDLDSIRKVLSEFDPSRDLTNSYVSKWIEKNGKKLFQNAVDLEHAANMMDEFDLRQRLIGIKNNVREEGSLAWWMNRKPLESFPVGSGKGATAKSLGLDIVSHETRSFMAFESITKSHSGLPNVFSSRQGAVGEGAAYGEGLYTRKGRRGATGSGITIRMKLRPDARLGTDFSLHAGGEYILIHNKQAVEVIQESLNLSPVDFFQKLAAGELLFDATDRAVVEKVNRKIRNRISTMDANDLNLIKTIVHDYVSNLNIVENDNSLLIEWFKISQWEDNKELVEKIKAIPRGAEFLVNQVYVSQDWFDFKEIESLVLDRKISKASWQILLTKEQSYNYPSWYEPVVEEVITQAKNHRNKLYNISTEIKILNGFFAKNHSQQSSEMLTHLLNSLNNQEFKFHVWLKIISEVLPYKDDEFAAKIISEATLLGIGPNDNHSSYYLTYLEKKQSRLSQSDLELVYKLMDSKFRVERLISGVLTRDDVTVSEDMIRMLLKNKENFPALLEYQLHRAEFFPLFKEHLEAFLQTDSRSVNIYIMNHIDQYKKAVDDVPLLLKKLFERDDWTFSLNNFKPVFTKLKDLLSEEDLLAAAGYYFINHPPNEYQIQVTMQLIDEVGLDREYLITEMLKTQRSSDIDYMTLLRGLNYYSERDLYPLVLQNAKYRANLAELIQNINEPQLILSQLLKVEDADLHQSLVKNFYQFPKSDEYVSFLEQIARSGLADDFIARYWLKRSVSAEHPEILRILLENGNVSERELTQSLNKPHWKRALNVKKRVDPRKVLDILNRKLGTQNHSRPSGTTCVESLGPFL